MNKIKFLAAFAALSLAFTSCNNEIDDTTGIGGGNNNGEKSVISLTIKNGDALTRGAANNEGTASDEESAIDISQKLKVIVYNEDGTLDYASETIELSLVGTNTYSTNQFKVTIGNKYFFVFANDGNSGKIQIPTPGTSMKEFMMQVIEVSRASSSSDILDITQDNNFLIGSMWKESKSVIKTGTEIQPTKIQVGIGRLASKVNLAAVEYNIGNANLEGTFSNAKYRLGTISKKIYTVGVHEGTSLPTSDGVLVTSYTHNAGVVNTTGDDANFYRYSNTWANPASSFYVTENTTALNANKEQKFGNTTYIQIETVYTPNKTEIYDPTDLTSNHDLAEVDGKTFYTAILKSTGKRLIFKELPASGTAHSDIDLTTILKYEMGKNYHKFVVFDPKESNDVIRNRVLRNHYYEFKLTKINDLGSHTSEVDPDEVVPTKLDVTLEISVKPWNKVSSDVEV